MKLLRYGGVKSICVLTIQWSLMKFGIAYLQYNSSR